MCTLKRSPAVSTRQPAKHKTPFGALFWSCAGQALVRRRRSSLRLTTVLRPVLLDVCPQNPSAPTDRCTLQQNPRHARVLVLCAADDIECWSQIICSPSLTNFRDPASRFSETENIVPAVSTRQPAKHKTPFGALFCAADGC